MSPSMSQDDPARAEIRRRDAWPRARRCACRSRPSTGHRENPRARHSDSSLSRVSVAPSSAAFGAARERSPRISQNMATCATRVCARGGMGEARDPRLSVADWGNRAFDLAQRPQRRREVKHRPRRRRRVRTGTPNRRRVPVGTGEPVRDAPALRGTLGEPMRQSGCAVSDSGLQADRAPPRRRRGRCRRAPSSPATRPA